MVDELDKRILKELSEDADQPVHKLAKKLKIPQTTLHGRITRLKKNRSIEKIVAKVNPEVLGNPVCALIHIQVQNHVSLPHVAQKISALDEVKEVFVTSSDTEITAVVHVQDSAYLSAFIMDTKTGLRMWPEISKVKFDLCVNTITK